MIYNMMLTECVAIRKTNRNAVIFRRFELVTDSELTRFFEIPKTVYKKVDIPKTAIKRVCGMRYPNINKLKVYSLKDLI